MTWIACAVLGACTFEPGGASSGTGDGGAGDAGADAQVFDGGPQPCVADETVCVGNVLETCDSAGDGYVDALRAICPLSCEGDDHCTKASNLDVSQQSACDGEAPALTPMVGATVTISSPDGVVLTCSDCGAGELVIPATGVQEAGDVDLVWFCLSEVDLPDGVDITVATNVDQALMFMVDGAVSLSGDVIVRGRDANAGSGRGQAGPGGGDGGGRSLLAGQPGLGQCPGKGGGQEGVANDFGAGGGGGGGHLGTGGAGGDGLSPTAGTLGAGGETSLGSCATSTLTPLVGGSGGGGGGDGTCGGACGWAGGGGGGAMQISSRTSIVVDGTIIASGGAGHGEASGAGSGGGGGGGGAGGAVLLEAPVVAVAGLLEVSGGAGGDSGGGSGAAGAAAGMVNGSNAGSAEENGDGGPGGGGGGGRVRLNAATAPACDATVSPNASCSAGTLLAGGVGGGS